MKKSTNKCLKLPGYIVMIISVALLGCNKDDDGKIAFSDWVEDGNYSVFKCGDSLEQSIADSLIIQFTYRESENDFYMEYHYWGGVNSMIYVGGDCYVTISSEGLFQGWSCSTWGGNRLLAPCKPELNQSWEYYNCFDDLVGQFTVIELDKVITVPAGTFSTFVIHDSYYDRNAYYNSKYGLIKLESTSSDNSEILSTFELVAKNF